MKLREIYGFWMFGTSPNSPDLNKQGFGQILCFTVLIHLIVPSDGETISLPESTPDEPSLPWLVSLPRTENLNPEVKKQSTGRRRTAGRAEDPSGGKIE